MRNNLLKLVVLALFAVTLTGAAVADLTPHQLRANIPFSFYAGGKLLPAGEYTFSIDQRVVTIGQNGTGTRLFVLGLPQDSSSNDRAVLTFESVNGEGYALHKIQGPDVGVGFKVSAARDAVRVQNQGTREVEVIAEVR